MATPASPVNAALQFKREATWGTDIAATKRMGVRLLEPDIAVGAILSGNMSGSRVRTGIAKGGHKARFTFETDMEYVHGATDPNGYLMLHDLIFGTGAASFGTYGGTPTGTGPIVHEFLNKPTLNSATMELIDGYPGAATTKCLQITGCKVEEAELSFGWSFDGEEHIPKWRVTMVGKTAAPDTAFTGSLTQQTADIISSKHCVVADGVLSPATSAYFSVKIKIKNNLYTEGFSSLSDYITEPVALNFLECTIEMEADYDSYTLLSNMISQTASAANISFAFTRPSSTTAYVVKALSGFSKITNHKYSVRPGSPVRQTFVWTPTKDSVGSAIIAQILSAGDCPGSQG